MSDQAKETTTLNAITDNLAESFFEGGASSSNILTPAETDDKDEKKEEKKELGSFNRPDPVSAEDILGDMLVSDKEIVDHVKPGPDIEAPKKEEDYNFLIDEGILAPFEDDSPIKSKKDLEKLIKANMEFKISEAKEATKKEEFEALPEELKFIIDYAKNGGTDLKTVFKLLGQTQEFRDYDVEKPEDQKSIVRAYYETQGWTEDEVEEELVNLVDSKRLQGQAQKLKPKLDKINQEELEERKNQQKLIEDQQVKAKKFFTDNVINTLKKGKIGDLDLTKEEQADIYNALVTESYQSINGKTNRLGALLDHIQYVKPDYEHLAEITMLATDREGFKKKLREKISTEVTAEQIKKIKTEQQKNKIGSTQDLPKESKRLPKLQSSFINPF